MTSIDRLNLYLKWWKNNRKYGGRNYWGQSKMRELYKIYLKGNAELGQMSKTIHYSGNTLLPKPFALSIVKYSDNEGYYLLYLDKFGEEQADTYHETLEDAFGQVEFEFGVKKMSG